MKLGHPCWYGTTLTRETFHGGGSTIPMMRTKIEKVGFGNHASTNKSSNCYKLLQSVDGEMADCSSPSSSFHLRGNLSFRISNFLFFFKLNAFIFTFCNSPQPYTDWYKGISFHQNFISLFESSYTLLEFKNSTSQFPHLCNSVSVW